MSSQDRKPSKTFKKNLSINVKPSVEIVTVWLSENFAPQWYQDAMTEAREGKDYGSRRREILFSACFAETYLFEWTRQLPAVGVRKILEYFPPKPRFHEDPRYKRGPKRNWKELLKELYDEEKIKVKPKLDLSQLGQLMKYRNGLVHALASRPATHNQPNNEKPIPLRNELEKMAPGWAIKIVNKLVRDFHDQLDTEVPDYIKDP